MLVVLVLDKSTNSVVCATKIPLRFEFEIGYQACFWTSYVAMVSKLVFHLAKQDSSRVYVWLCDEAIAVSLTFLLHDRKADIQSLTSI